MARLNSGLRYAFNLSASSDRTGQQSWEGHDGYKVIVVSGSGTAAAVDPWVFGDFADVARPDRVAGAHP